MKNQPTLGNLQNPDPHRIPSGGRIQNQKSGIQNGHSGEDRLRAAIRRKSARPARRSDPQPYDDDWGWWIEQRLARLEVQIKWLVGLAAGALAAEVIRLALEAFRF
jgi:hypothetical protein